ncbi:hypothetical protein [Lacticaseibacillus suihuaensis]
MASDRQFDQLVAALGRANQRLQQLTDIDYPTAAYKGYSAAGETLDEVLAAIEETQANIDRLEARLAEWDAEGFDEPPRV